MPELTGLGPTGGIDAKPDVGGGNDGLMLPGGCGKDGPMLPGGKEPMLDGGPAPGGTIA